MQIIASDILASLPESVAWNSYNYSCGCTPFQTKRQQQLQPNWLMNPFADSLLNSSTQAKASSLSPK